MASAALAGNVRWFQRTDALISQLAGGVAVAVGVLIALLIAAAIPDRDIALLLGIISVGATGVGLLLIRFPTTVPIPLLDGALILADIAIVVLSRSIDPAADPLTNAFPGIYLLIGMIIFAVRGPWTICVHTATLGASYALVLTLGTEVNDPAIRWLLTMMITIASGLLIRWLTSTLAGLAAAERASRALAETATDDLRRANETKDVFLSQMSHELRTPLNVMQGFANLLIDGQAGALNDVQQEYAGYVGESSRHLVDLVEDVLDITTIESGDSRLTIEDVNLDAAINESLRVVGDTTERREQTITVDVAPGVTRVAADRVRLRQILVNLLTNAVKFTPALGSIDLRAIADGDRVRITVTDTGIGIEPRDQDRIFEEYIRSRPEIEGTGLGLPLARRLVELHGGALTVQSAPGEGSSFSFDLPRTHEQLLASRREHDDDAVASTSTALTVPGSLANRALLSSIATRLFLLSSAFGLVVALITPLSTQERVGVFALSAAGMAFAVLLELRPIVLSQSSVEIWMWGSAAVIPAVAYGASRFTDVIPLTNAWLIIVVFALWMRSHAIVHFAWIAALNAVLLLRHFTPEEQTTYAALLVPLLFTAVEVTWLMGRVRSLVESEQAAHLAATLTQRELATASRHKSTFVANMSHELRTPLNTIIGFSDLLRSDAAGPLTSTQHEYLVEIDTAARHLLSIINDVLDVATLEADRLELHYTQVSVADLIESAIARAVDPTDAVAVDVVVDPDAESIDGDAERLEQALAALVANAFAFTRPGGVVRIAAYAVLPLSVAIEVSDTGVGIGAAELATIFEPFHQGASPPVNERRRGTGLGLSLARSLVELHGGTVTVASEPGRGSTFRVKLPAHRLASADAR